MDQILQLRRLTFKEKQTVEQVDSYEQLCDKLEKIQTQYRHKTWVRLLAKMDPFLLKLHSFATVLAAFARDKPELLSLFWSSVALVLEVCIPLTPLPSFRQSNLGFPSLACRQTLESLGKYCQYL